MSERLGCSSHSCYLEKPTGQGTNGPCSCLDGMSTGNRIKLLKYLHRIKNRLESAWEKRWKELEKEFERLFIAGEFTAMEDYVLIDYIRKVMKELKDDTK